MDLRALRKSKGLTLSELAEKLNVSPSTILRWENGDIAKRFTVFVRQPLILPECFSIGLIWMCEELDENPILFRCNGPHGGNEKITEHFVPHIHKFKLQTLDDEPYSIEKTIEATTEYSTFDGALYYFLTTCNILDAEQYFPTAYEISLFDS
nr:MAG TPA: Helix-turn-helix XRE-family like protein [Caudoviricetes sp.]